LILPKIRTDLTNLSTEEKTGSSMTGKINRSFLLSVSSLAFLLVSCGRNVVFTDAKMLPESIWKVEDIKDFRVPVSDTLNSSNIFFTIRTGTAYPFRNIYLFVTTSSPDGRTLTDTLQYNLADEKGEWFGKGFGDIHELNLPYRTNVFFPAKGTYVFKIQHGMRTEDLKGVYDIGLRIEKIRK
jgi:gliding motility-associated lipoprotein GldH